MLDPLPVPACLIDAQGQRFIGVNRHFEKLLGYSRSELLAMAWHGLLPVHEMPLAERALERVLAGDRVPGPIEWQVRRRDGTILKVATMSRRISFVHDDGRVSDAFISLVVGTEEQPPRKAEDVFGPA